MRDPYLDRIKRVVLDQLEGVDADIFLFGSRAAGKARPDADVDIGVEGSKPLDADLLNGVRGLLRESTIPYKVDLVDFRTVDADFASEAKRRIVIWKKARQEKRTRK